MRSLMTSMGVKARPATSWATHPVPRSPANPHSRGINLLPSSYLRQGAHASMFQLGRRQCLGTTEQKSCVI